MTDTLVFSKIRNVKESEKNSAQKAYHQSMEFFEEVATKLYHLLRKKEAAEASYESYLQQSIPLEKLKQQMAYIERLNNQIVNMQSEVQKARDDMQTKQLKLTDAHVEVKKFENIIEARHQSEKEREKKYEKDMMDEISLTQYLSTSN